MKIARIAALAGILVMPLFVQAQTSMAKDDKAGNHLSPLEHLVDFNKPLK